MLNTVLVVAQIASPVLYAFFIVVIYLQLRSAQESVREIRQEFLAGGRPTVAVHDEYDAAAGSISLVVENIGQGPAKNVGFEFPRRIEASDGLVISELPLYSTGLTSLSPSARITCHWDDFEDLMAMLHRQGLEGVDFTVVVHYTDLTGARYSNDWNIQPAIYRGLRHRSAAGGTGAADAPAQDTGSDPEPDQTGASSGPPDERAVGVGADGSPARTDST